MSQRHPIQKLHRNEGMPVLRAGRSRKWCKCWDDSDADAACASRLKANQSMRILRHVIGQKLERYKTMQTNIFGLVNHAHTAATDLVDDAVMRDGLANA